ncbi:hypothetical protein [Dyadobacter jiangsuensis]|uniref:hypothetical protein n=1 Tax=Dyadobacter jiangsuensis TaxID=1591085 RepID=UPI001473FEB2|nr:hypothetical protein [Dyadobacter jiangsuensis]
MLDVPSGKNSPYVGNKKKRKVKAGIYLDLLGNGLGIPFVNQSDASNNLKENDQQ